ncbi:MAG TPA: hypothetical protein DCM08_03825 [Microscillaceae bacterium]|jgi:hypothetical protein|nr:hypothetical protein [Microscillaceae bacterium]
MKKTVLIWVLSCFFLPNLSIAQNLNTVLETFQLPNDGTIVPAAGLTNEDLPDNLLPFFFGLDYVKETGTSFKPVGRIDHNARYSTTFLLEITRKEGFSPSVSFWVVTFDKEKLKRAARQTWLAISTSENMLNEKLSAYSIIGLAFDDGKIVFSMSDKAKGKYNYYYLNESAGIYTSE